MRTSDMEIKLLQLAIDLRELNAVCVPFGAEYLASTVRRKVDDALARVVLIQRDAWTLDRALDDAWDRAR